MTDTEWNSLTGILAGGGSRGGFAFVRAVSDQARWSDCPDEEWVVECVRSDERATVRGTREIDGVSCAVWALSDGRHVAFPISAGGVLL